MTAFLIVIAVAVCCAAAPILIQGQQYYLRGKLEAKYGKPLFVSYSIEDGLVQRLFFRFWDWCEKRGYESGVS